MKTVGATLVFMKTSDPEKPIESTSCSLVHSFFKKRYNLDIYAIPAEEVL